MTERRYETVSEAPGVGVTREAFSMLITRYSVASTIGRGRRVLEVACGAGMGLGAIERTATKVIGGDYSETLLNAAKRHYRDRVPLVRFDAHALPFRAGAFDVVVLYEAIYYLARADEFVREARRVLAPNGVLVVCSANCESSAFNPSPFSTRYWSIPDLSRLLCDASFDVTAAAAFPEQPRSLPAHAVHLLKRSAIALGVMPRTMKGKEAFKRIFLGKLQPLPAELPDDHDAIAPLTPLAVDDVARQYKVVYTIGRSTS